MIRPSDSSDISLDLDRAFAALTPKQKLVLTLYYDGFTQAEIGVMLGVSHQAVSRLLKRGGCKMADLLPVVCRDERA